MLPLCIILGTFFALGFGVKNALYADTALIVKNVVVEPNVMFQDPDVRDLEKRLLGKNILQVDLNWVSNELEKDPEILKAQIDRKMPNSLHIQIETRQSLAVVKTPADNRYAVISQDGMVVDLLREQPPGFVLIQIGDANTSRFRLGKIINARGLEQAIDFIELYASHPFSLEEKVSRLQLDPQGNIAIVLGEGPEVRLGKKPAAKIDELSKLEPILERQGRSEIDYIDMQYKQIVVKRRGK